MARQAEAIIVQLKLRYELGQKNSQLNMDMATGNLLLYI